MVRIAGINLHDKKHILISLQSIYGIGFHRATQICKNASVDVQKKVSDLNESEVNKIRSSISEFNYTIEGDLRREVNTNIKRLMDIGSYRGMRHRKGLPVRGQNTKTNARTRKGPRRLVKG